MADRERGSLIVKTARIVEERRVRRQAGDLARSQRHMGAYTQSAVAIRVGVICLEGVPGVCLWLAATRARQVRTAMP
jgi:hypothetical protein